MANKNEGASEGIQTQEQSSEELTLDDLLNIYGGSGGGGDGIGGQNNDVSGGW